MTPIETEQCPNNEGIREMLPDVIMVMGMRDPWKDKGGMAAAESMAGAVALMWHLAEPDKKPLILSAAANIKSSPSENNPQYKEYSQVLSSLLEGLGVDPEYFVFEDTGFETNIELRFLRRLYLRSRSVRSGSDNHLNGGSNTKVEIVAFHNKDRVKKLLSFLKSKGKGIDGNTTVDRPREIFDRFKDKEGYQRLDEDLRLRIEKYVLLTPDNTKAEQKYKLLNIADSLSSILGYHSNPNNITYLASLKRTVRIPYEGAVDSFTTQSRTRKFGRKSLDIVSRLSSKKKTNT
ncbi:MAG: hypothetical protein ACYDAS_00890 [Patescibacteria group bacterium]